MPAGDGVKIGPDAPTPGRATIRDSQDRDARLFVDDPDHSTWRPHKVDGGGRTAGAVPE